MKKIKVLAIVGSLREGSYNKQLALAAKEIIGDRADFEIVDYSDVPLFNEDIEFPAPEPVQRLRNKVLEADGIWFFTPEYNHFFPGVLKNLIDWLSRTSKGVPQVFARKCAAISGITPGMSGTGIAQDHLVTLLSFLNMRIMNFPRLTIPNALQQVKDGKLELTDSKPYLEKQVEAFLKFVQKELDCQ
ncbi:MAG: NAD(P)H-dependent oxidoreductase [Desulfitobacterium sp.]|nr:NAD(P)H-dependent oxidoreductase [Desulfitobacterium sp.]